MESFNAKMITLAREYRGITQSQLAQKIPGLNQGNLSKMEKGILNVPENILNQIAKTLNFPTDFFFKSIPKMPIHSFYFRKRQTMPKKISMVLQAQIDLIRVMLDELLLSVEIPEYNLPSIDVTLKPTPEEAAQHIRNVLKIGKGPIDKLISILEKHGIIIYFLDSESDKFDGITVFTDNNYPVIIINKNMPNDRKRFTIGHELGHLVMHIPFFYYRDSDELEREAHRFSAEFNMPKAECRNDLIRLKYYQLGHLKDYWKLSKAAIIYRAKEIGAITEQTYKYLLIELSRRGERKVELGNVPIDEPQIVSQLIEIHQNELGYNLNELSKVLSISKTDFNLFFKPNRRFLRIA
jgi:Zn-dependent peptidase ImmA (M78 family)/DNA-binding XRE family transcriptional regulator